VYTITASPTHVIPVQSQTPTLRDSLSGGALDLRRRWTRPMKNWDLIFPGQQERLGPLMGLLDVAQGDEPCWFDGGATIEITEPILIGTGNGTITDFILPYRYMFVATMVVYLNGGATNTWQPVGGDAITCQQIRFSSAPPNFTQIKMKGRRKTKVVVDTEQGVVMDRAFRNQTDANNSLYSLKVTLQEIP
jgi:hypothetical protein